jgi:phage host-nuclease inhibitor protein Gam
MLGDLKEALAAIKEAIFVAEHTKKNADDIEKIRIELERVVRVVERMADRFDHEIQNLKSAKNANVRTCASDWRMRCSDGKVSVPQLSTN